jgi:hypothetical protein
MGQRLRWDKYCLLISTSHQTHHTRESTHLSHVIQYTLLRWDKYCLLISTSHQTHHTRESAHLSHVIQYTFFESSVFSVFQLSVFQLNFRDRPTLFLNLQFFQFFSFQFFSLTFGTGRVRVLKFLLNILSRHFSNRHILKCNW